MLEFTWEPNHPDLLWQEWLDNWNEHGDEGVIAWALFDDDRKLVVIETTDVNGEWVADGEQGFDGVIAIIKHYGVRNVIGIHQHKVSDGEGPCDGLGEFCSATFAAFEDAGLRLRCTLIGNVNGFDGMMAPVDPNAVPLGGAMGGMDRMTMVIEGMRLADHFSKDDNLTDEEKAVFAEAIDTILADIIAGQEPDMDAIFRATDLADRKAREQGMEMDMSAIDEAKALHEQGKLRKKQPPKPDPLSLPSLNINDIRFMN